MACDFAVDAHGEAADNVDERDQNGRHRIPAHKFARPVHGPVKIRLLLHGPPPAARLILLDESGVEFRINRHLFPGQCVQREARRHFRDAPGPLGDHDEIDQRQNQEHHHAHHIIAPHHHVAKRLDDVAGVTIQQNQPRRSHVQRQPVEGDEQQQRGEPGKFCRGAQVKNHQQRQQRKTDADRQQQVQQQGGHGQNQHQDRAKQRKNQPQVTVFQQLAYSITQCSHDLLVPSGFVRRNIGSGSRDRPTRVLPPPPRIAEQESRHPPFHA